MFDTGNIDTCSSRDTESSETPMLRCNIYSDSARCRRVFALNRYSSACLWAYSAGYTSSDGGDAGGDGANATDDVDSTVSRQYWPSRGGTSWAPILHCNMSGSLP